jgi:type III restriction enzyme
VIIQTNQQVKVYADFELDTSFGFSFSAPTEEIIIESLKTSEVTTLKDDSQPVLPDTPVNMIVGEILNIAPGINYRQYGQLFAKLAGQALEHIDAEAEKVVLHYKKDIARHIWEQLDSHSSLTPPEYEIKLLRSAVPILQQDYTKFKEDDILKFTANIPAYEIRKKVVGQFTKACHTAYKFDSVPEHIFAIVLERSANVIKWLRPARDQFKIYFGNQRYQPDFLVETAKYIYIVEIKASNRSDDLEVKLKAKAAQEYCANVNTIFAGTGKKLWKYMFLLDNECTRHTEFSYLENEVERWAVG